MNVLITGGTSGIGKQLALDYKKDGHEVWVVGRNQASLTQLQSGGFHTGQVDLMDRQQSLDWFATLDSLDLAILNAGTCEYVDVQHFDSTLFNRVIHANLDSMAISIEGVLPLLRRGTAPHLVAVGSSAAFLPLSRAEAYGASKAAIAYLMNTLRVDLYSENIDVSLVCPGFVKTPLTDRNDFPMPFRISTEEASSFIRKGIEKRKAEIHFPKRFTLMLKILSLLPEKMWARVAQRMIADEK